MARSERFKQIRLETIRNLPKEKHNEQSLKIANEIKAAETNHNPVANTDKYSVRVGHTLVVDAKNSVLLNDTDADGNKLEVIPATVKSVNGVDITIDKDGTFTYDAKSAAAGPDSFTYQVSDGRGGITTGTVEINVVANTPPVANTDDYSIRVGDTLVVDAKNSVLLNDTDADGDKLEVISATVKSDNGIFVAIDKDGTFTYDAKSAAAGPDSFTYQVSDGHGGVVTGTVKINVVANTPPVANTDDYSIRVGDTLVVDAKNSVLLNDTDADGDKLEVMPATVISDNGIFVAIDKDGTFTYDAKSAAAGPDSFTYQVSDDHGGVVTGTVKINVVANTPPVANKDVYKVRVGDTLVVNAKNSVLLNDTDADGDKLEVISATVKSANGIFVAIDKDGTFTYDAKSAAAGPDSFTYQVSDGHGGRIIGTVEIDVESASTTPPPACPAYVGDFKDLAKKVSEGGQHKLFVTKAVEFKKGIEDDKSAGTTNYLDSAGKVRDAMLKDLLKIGEYTFDVGGKSSANSCTKSNLDTFCTYGLRGKQRLVDSQVKVFLEKSECIATLAKIEKKICTDLNLSSKSTSADIDCIKGYVQDHFCSDITLTTGTNAFEPGVGVCVAGGMDYLDHINCL